MQFRIGVVSQTSLFAHNLPYPAHHTEAPEDGVAQHCRQVIGRTARGAGRSHHNIALTLFGDEHIAAQRLIRRRKRRQFRGRRLVGVPPIPQHGGYMVNRLLRLKRTHNHNYHAARAVTAAVKIGNILAGDCLHSFGEALVGQSVGMLAVKQAVKLQRRHFAGILRTDGERGHPLGTQFFQFILRESGETHRLVEHLQQKRQILGKRLPAKAGRVLMPPKGEACAVGFKFLKEGVKGKTAGAAHERRGGKL